MVARQVARLTLSVDCLGAAVGHQASGGILNGLHQVADVLGCDPVIVVQNQRVLATRQFKCLVGRHRSVQAVVGQNQLCLQAVRTLAQRWVVWHGRHHQDFNRGVILFANRVQCFLECVSGNAAYKYGN